MWYDTPENMCQWGAVFGASLVASAWDLKTGRIPNLLTIPVALGGLVMATWVHGPAGCGEAVIGWGMLAMPYVLLFLLGRGGAGDAKMMGAIGAWLGIEQALIVAICVACTGGVLALFKIALHRRRWAIFRNLGLSLYVYLVSCAGGAGGWNVLKTSPEEQRHETSGQVTIPYGLAIFLGVCLGAMVVYLWIA
jgi:Flp pilus assembly protein protease CpaA